MSNKTAARQSWCDNDALEAGRRLFEDMALDERGKWAANVLDLATKHSPVSVRQVDQLLAIAKNPRRWPESHRQFDAIRNLTLKLQARDMRSAENEVRLGLCGVAENIAKVLYNLTSPRDPFDEDAGWWVVVNLHDFVQVCDDELFRDEVFSLLFD